MRAFIISLFFALSVSNYAFVAVSRADQVNPDEPPPETCPPGQYPCEYYGCCSCGGIPWDHPNAYFTTNCDWRDCYGNGGTIGYVWYTSIGWGRCEGNTYSTHQSCVSGNTMNGGTIGGALPQVCTPCPDGQSANSTHTGCDTLPHFTINYSGPYAPRPNNCVWYTSGNEHHTNCKLDRPTGSASCHNAFDAWLCTSGCNDDTPLLYADPNIGIDFAPYVSYGAEAITLTAQWTSECPNGYYCANGERHPCPAGSTSSNTATQCASQVTDCHISNTTQFRDKHGTFTLPVGNIYYHLYHE